MRMPLFAMAVATSLSTVAMAQSTFTGTRTVGSLTANVTLTTDGSTGALSASDILGFTVDFSDGTSIAGTSQNVSAAGSALIASTTQIGFNFDYPVGPNGTYFALVGQNATVENSLYCVQIVFACGANGTGEVANTFDGYGQFQFQAQTGFVPLFTLVSESAPVPEPATWAMMLLGFFAIAFAVRQRKTACEQLA